MTLSPPNTAPQASSRCLPEDWLDYGPDDPLDSDAWLNPCTKCGEMPKLRMTGKSHVVHCECCGAKGTPGRLAFQAVINWNKAPISRHPHFTTIPFFGLAGLSCEDARQKLNLLRAHLEERKRTVELRVRSGVGAGVRYEQRIRAYLAWAIYAQGLVKEAELDAERSALERGTGGAA